MRFNHHNNIGIIIQARMGSKRLPRKVMKKIAGKEMILRIIERVKKCKSFKKVIIAIPETEENNILYNFLKKYNVNLYRGSENNLLKRYYLAAKKFQIQFIIRLPADNPFPDFNEIDRLTSFYFKNLNKKKLNLYSTNLQPFKNSGYIDGVGAEIFTINMLEKLLNNKKIVKSYEHISLNFVNFEKQREENKKYFKVKCPKAPKEISYPKIKLDVNSKQDLSYVRNIYRNLTKKKLNFSTQNIVQYLLNEKKLS